MALEFENGIREFPLDGDVLRFNPADPGLQSRFLEIGERIGAITPQGSTPAEKWADADCKCRQILQWVFPGNDFFALLGGVNLVALCPNGNTVLANFLQALTPVVEQGMRDFAQQLLREEAKV